MIPLSCGLKGFLSCSTRLLSAGFNNATRSAVWRIAPARFKSTVQLEHRGLQVEDDGDYDVILPEDVAQFQLSGELRDVPESLQRPYYAQPAALQKFKETKEFTEEYKGDGLIPLGGKEEKALRQVASTAAKILGGVRKGIDEGVRDLLHLYAVR